MPTVRSVIPGPNTVTVHFDPPADTGGVPLTNYQVSFNDGLTWNTRTPASTSSPLVFTFASNSIHARVKLRAMNVAGVGPATPTVTVTVGTLPVGSRPASVAFAPDGTFAYVTNRADGTVSRLSTADDRQVAVVPVGSSPGALAFGADVAFVANRNDDTVSRLQFATDTVTGASAVGDFPSGVAFMPNGAFAYVVNQGSGTVSKVLANGTVAKSIKVGTWPTDVKIAPSGAYAYVTNGWERTISKISTATDSVVGTIPIGTPQVEGNPYGGGPTRVAFAPDGTFAYVTSDDDASLARVDTDANTVTKTTLGGTPRGVAIRPDCAEAYVTDEAADYVSRIRTSDTTVQSTIFVGMQPSSVAYAPDGSFAYVVNSGEGTVSRVGVAGAPRGLMATPGNGSATISFASPASDGGASVSNYAYTTSADGGATWSPWTSLAPASQGPSVTVPGLTNGTAYRVKLRALNSYGSGTPSAAVAVTPRTTPGAPTITSVTGGIRQVSVAFTAPGSNGGAAISNYEYSVDGGAWTAAKPPATPSQPLVIAGLPNGISVAVRLRAVNVAGPGAASNSVSATTLPLLAAPTSLVATPGNGWAQIAFTPPGAPGTAPITNYEYALSADAGVTWGAWTALSPPDAASPITIGALTNGTTYRLKLRAVNAVGAGAASAVVVVTPVAPGPPGMVFVAVDPARVADTRVSAGGAGPIPARTSRVLSVASVQAGGAPVVPVGATAIAYNVTVPLPGQGGHLRVMPGDATELTDSSAINFRAGETIANGLTVKIDAQRRVAVYASVQADAIIDVVGYFVPSAGGGAPAAQYSSGRFTAITPVRVYDSDVDREGALPGKTARLVSTATTQDGLRPVVPAGASAVAYNLTVVQPAQAGFLQLMPGDVESSMASTINWTMPRDMIANGLTVRVDAQRQVRVFNAASVPVTFRLDVVGYYSDAGALFYPTDPARVFDSRAGAAPISNGLAGQRDVSVANALAGGEQVPAGAAAIAYNLTATNTTSQGHLRVFPAGQPLVTASTINWPAAGYNRANGTIVAVSGDRHVIVYNGSATPADALIDTLGYYK